MKHNPYLLDFINYEIDDVNAKIRSLQGIKILLQQDAGYALNENDLEIERQILHFKLKCLLELRKIVAPTKAKFFLWGYVVSFGKYIKKYWLYLK